MGGLKPFNFINFINFINVIFQSVLSRLAWSEHSQWAEMIQKGGKNLRKINTKLPCWEFCPPAGQDAAPGGMIPGEALWAQLEYRETSLL